MTGRRAVCSGRSVTHTTRCQPRSRRTRRPAEISALRSVGGSTSRSETNSTRHRAPGSCSASRAAISGTRLSVSSEAGPGDGQQADNQLRRRGVGQACRHRTSPATADAILSSGPAAADSGGQRWRRWGDDTDRGREVAQRVRAGKDGTVRVDDYRGQRGRQGEPLLLPPPDPPGARRGQRIVIHGDRASGPAHDPVHVRIVNERVGQAGTDQVVDDRLRRAHDVGDELPHVFHGRHAPCLGPDCGEQATPQLIWDPVGQRLGIGRDRGGHIHRPGRPAWQPLAGLASAETAARFASRFSPPLSGRGPAAAGTR